MSVVRVNGGIINNQTLTGGLRYFKMVGPFAWTVSDGSVNLNVKLSGGDITSTSYFVVGDGKPVPGSAAELALLEISKKADIVVISLQPQLGAGTTEIHFACSASSFGWGSDTPDYSTPPANQDEDLSAAAPQMQAAVRSLGTVVVPSTVGVPNQTLLPVTAARDLGAVVITEVQFKLA